MSWSHVGDFPHQTQQEEICVACSDLKTPVQIKCTIRMSQIRAMGTVGDITSPRLPQMTDFWIVN